MRCLSETSRLAELRSQRTLGDQLERRSSPGRGVTPGRRGQRHAEVIGMPLGRVGHRLGSGRARGIFFPACRNRDPACGFLPVRGRRSELGY